jgi:putative redox protein
VTGVWQETSGGAGALSVHVAPRGTGTSTGGSVVLLHGFPLEPHGAAAIGSGFPALADRLAAESEWRVVTGCLRGVGPSEGDFSLQGWLDDIGALVDHACSLGDGPAVRLVGFGAGGTLALCHGAVDERVGGVACLGSVSSFRAWAGDVDAVLDFARAVGVVRTPGFPEDVEDWAAPFTALAPTDAVARLAPRPVLVVHGTNDEGVPVAEARALVDAGGVNAELRLVAGAGHRLRADPRAIALLVGWLERQGP